MCQEASTLLMQFLTFLLKLSTAATCPLNILTTDLHSSFVTISVDLHFVLYISELSFDRKGGKSFSMEKEMFPYERECCLSAGGGKNIKLIKL